MNNNSKNTTTRLKPNKIHNNLKANKKDNKVNKYLILPLIIITCILPFIVKSHVYNPNLSGYSWFSNTEYFIDFFLYYKQWLFIILSVVMLVIILIKTVINKKILIFTPLFIPLGIYAFLAFISTVFSKYSYFGYNGIYENFESIFAILGYCLVAYYSYIIINSEYDIRLLFKYFFISLIIISLLGITQAIGFDFFKTDLGKKLVLSKEFWGRADELTFNMGKNRVYLTLFNPNYVGTYVSLTVPIVLTLLIFKRNIKTILYYLLIIIGLFICLLGSQSMTALIGIFISILFIIFFLRHQIVTRLKYIVPLTLVLLISLFMFNNLNNNIILAKFNTIFNNKVVDKSLSSIKTNDENISLEYKDNILNISFLTTNGQFSGFLFTDNSGEIINSSQIPNSLASSILDDRFSDIQVEPCIYFDYLSFQVKINNHIWYFTNQAGNNTYYYINNNGRPDKIIQTESTIFTGHEFFASGRGYIWSKTIPLLKDHILLGSGADSFVLAFPHQDYLDQFYYGYSNALINKPHNMYLQIGVQSGVLSLIALIVFYLMYFVSCIRIYYKSDFSNYLSQIGIAIFIGSVSYMICGLTNDSSITVAPIFWTLLGIGISVNKLVKQANNNKI